jgi:glycosyltransferase involved in cell wall biosynthesis
MKKKMILFIGGTTGGGVATINNEVIRIFRKAGHEYALVDTEKMKSKVPTPVAYVLCYIIAFFEILIGKPDLVYLQLAQTGYRHQSFFLAIAKSLGKETVAHLHAKSDLKGTTTEKQFNDILSSRKYIDKMILLTKSCMDDLVENGWDKPAYVIPNFISTDSLPTAIKPVTQRDKLLYLGRMNWEKGIYEVLEIARRLGDEQILFVGNIDNEKDRKKFTKELESVDNACWLGPMYGNDKYNVIADSKFLIFPTRRDEFPMTLIESTALGCVPLVSPVGSVGEIIRDGYNGFYISPDDVDGIVDTILRWKDDPGLQEISDNGMEFTLRNFTSDAVEEKLLEIVG